MIPSYRSDHSAAQRVAPALSSAAALPGRRCAQRSLEQRARDQAARGVRAARATGRPVIVTLMRKLRGVDPLDLLLDAEMRGQEAVYVGSSTPFPPTGGVSGGASSASVSWRAVPTGGAVEVCGVGALVTASNRGIGCLERTQRRIDRVLRRVLEDPSAPRAGAARFVGAFPFGATSARFVLPCRMAVRPAGAIATWWVGAAVVGPNDDVAAVARRLARRTRRPGSRAREGADGVTLGPVAGVRPVEDRASFIARVERALEGIERGALTKVVLARAVDVRVIGPMRASSLLQRLSAREQGTVPFAILGASGSGSWVGATPERLVVTTPTRIRTGALAGSRPREADPRADERGRRSLLESAKDLHEHAAVAQSIRAALGRVDPRGSTWFARAPRALTLSSVHHLYTPISHRIARPLGALAAAAALHPTPAVGGAPRGAAKAWLERNEPLDRGLYCGAVGWLGRGGRGDLMVALRVAHLHAGRVRAFAGAGIVRGSDPGLEWEETRVKLCPILTALDLDEGRGPRSGRWLGSAPPLHAPWGGRWS